MEYLDSSFDYAKRIDNLEQAQLKAESCKNSYSVKDVRILDEKDGGCVDINGKILIFEPDIYKSKKSRVRKYDPYIPDLTERYPEGFSEPSKYDDYDDGYMDINDINEEIRSLMFGLQTFVVPEVIDGWAWFDKVDTLYADDWVYEEWEFDYDDKDRIGFKLKTKPLDLSGFDE